MLHFCARAAHGAKTALVVAILLALLVLPAHANSPLANGALATSPAGWHSRASPHLDGAAYDIKKENLVLAMTRSSVAESGGLVVALFQPNVAIDSGGRVVVLTESDWSAFVDLASQTTALLKTAPHKYWEIKHDTTCQPSDNVYLATSSGLQGITVSGYDDHNMMLTSPVGQFTHLPESLSALMSYALEARRGFEFGYKNEVIDKVRAIVEVDWIGRNVDEI